ncbi:glutamine synthetase-like isoform X1 [Cryptomeria japonica]|uniref:glutamine synthetase-like isoform X1 n=1 Tax=Cryptomeria japonica TaxID=3369 RepID=UPI0027DA9BB5|nr:glutamine synthetase-like isoform X1 [Cryptomeria japonica]XP_059065680.1 glutamine synthetase-like isoform X1 [Cryptomeria japonica]XP_059065682.1 glutamine synthetase-like isoform X1 [Cryptomeria japonica]XP_059065683.1 glutamine synthetase-like isoform X1 [Cryptomeria japonica]
MPATSFSIFHHLDLGLEEWTNYFAFLTPLSAMGNGITFFGPVSDPKDLPKWNYDGSSIAQVLEKDSEVILQLVLYTYNSKLILFKDQPVWKSKHALFFFDLFSPQAIFRNPFCRRKNTLGISDRYKFGCKQSTAFKALKMDMQTEITPNMNH